MFSVFWVVGVGVEGEAKDRRVERNGIVKEMGKWRIEDVSIVLTLW